MGEVTRKSFLSSVQRCFRLEAKLYAGTAGVFSGAPPPGTAKGRKPGRETCWNFNNIDGYMQIRNCIFVCWRSLFSYDFVVEDLCESTHDGFQLRQLAVV
jgi:hypothetical protein